MNLLAHFYLAGTTPELRVGNFIGDAVKGSNFDAFPDQIAEGIIMHRDIDSYADNHSVTQSAKRNLSKYRHYSSVIIDIFYDHFLAKNWEDYHEQPLSSYAIEVYKDLANYKKYFPKKSKKMYKYMIRHNWLEVYATVDGINRVLNGLSKRTIFKSKMEQATEELILHYDDFEAAFKEFFPDIVEHTANYRNS